MFGEILEWVLSIGEFVIVVPQVLLLIVMLITGVAFAASLIWKLVRRLVLLLVDYARKGGEL